MSVFFEGLSWKMNIDSVSLLLVAENFKKKIIVALQIFNIIRTILCVPFWNVTILQ